MTNVICIRWGAKYPPEYVNKLYAMVARNLSAPFRFVCFTDSGRNGFRREIETAPIPDIELPERQRDWPWRKVSLFAPRLGDLTGPALFLDLDLVVTGQLRDFFEYPGDFCVIENWRQAGQGVGNTSVYRFIVGAYPDLYEFFRRDPAAIIAKHRNSQSFVSHHLRGRMTFWPDAWVRSFKVHCLPPFPKRLSHAPQLPEGARIVAFPGEPKMADAAAGRWRGGPHKFFRPARWIESYWRE